MLVGDLKFQIPLLCIRQLFDTTFILSFKLMIFETLLQAPSISVILPFYNVKATLSRAIESVMVQTFSDFECILVNNNSSDGSAQLAQNYCNKDPRFHLVHETRRGVTFAHNTGLTVARGTFIARMDADDWMFPSRLRRQHAFLVDNPEVDVVAGLAEYVPHREHTLGFQRYVNWSNGLVEKKDIELQQFVESPIINPTAMWRRHISELHGSYEHGNFPEDYELWLRWMSKGVDISKLPVKVIKWYDSDERLTRSDHRYSDQAFFGIKTQYLVKWLEKHNLHHPKVGIWGASKISRQRAVLLKKYGIEIQCYIDISSKRGLEHEVLHYQEIPEPGSLYILVYLKESSMKANTIAYLESKGYREGTDFLLVS